MKIGNYYSVERRKVSVLAVEIQEVHTPVSQVSSLSYFSLENILKIP